MKLTIRKIMLTASTFLANRHIMTTLDADRMVLEQLLAQAAGIRMRAKNPLIGTRAGLLEQELAARLRETELRSAASVAAFFADEVPVAMAASHQPGGDR